MFVPWSFSQMGFGIKWDNDTGTITVHQAFNEYSIKDIHDIVVSDNNRFDPNNNKYFVGSRAEQLLGALVMMSYLPLNTLEGMVLDEAREIHLISYDLVNSASEADPRQYFDESEIIDSEGKDVIGSWLRNHGIFVTR